MIRPIALGAVAAAAVGAFGKGDGPRLAPASPVSLPGCSSLMYGGEGAPDVLIAASTSLHGRAAEYGVQDGQALKLVLEKHGWRAGRFGVGLQICDEMSRPSFYSVHTAQAAHVLLDAIAASDGTRADVTRRVLRTRVEDGLLGDFAFDHHGDTTLNTVSVYRIEEGRLRLKTTISASTAERIARQ
jgi:hypothetical protein